MRKVISEGHVLRAVTSEQQLRLKRKKKLPEVRLEKYVTPRACYRPWPLDHFTKLSAYLWVTCYVQLQVSNSYKAKQNTHLPQPLPHTEEKQQQQQQQKQNNIKTKQNKTPSRST